MLTKRIVGQDDEDVVEYSYAYNPLNQLTEFEDAEGNVTSYAYDGTGMRVSKPKGEDVQKFYWDRGYAKRAKNKYGIHLICLCSF